MELGFLPDIHLDDCHEEELIDELNNVLHSMKDCDYIFFMGDMIDETSKKKDRRRCERIKRTVEKYDNKFIFLEGNNESDSEINQQIPDILGQDSYYGHIEVDKIDIIYLNTNHPKTNYFYEIGNEQMRWFKEKAEKSSRFILLSHHPIAGFDFTGNYWYPDRPEKVLTFDRVNALRIAKKNNLVGSVGAHVHNNRWMEENNRFHTLIDTFHRRHDGDYVTGSHMRMNLSADIKFDFYGEERLTKEFSF